MRAMRRLSCRQRTSAPACRFSPERPDSTNRLTPVATDTSTEQLLQRVRAMIDQSEQRQQRELALRLSQVHAKSTRSIRPTCCASSRISVSSRKALMNYLVRTSGGVK